MWASPLLLLLLLPDRHVPAPSRLRSQIHRGRRQCLQVALALVAHTGMRLLPQGRLPTVTRGFPAMPETARLLRCQSYPGTSTASRTASRTVSWTYGTLCNIFPRLILFYCLRLGPPPFLMAFCLITMLCTKRPAVVELVLG